MDAGILGSRRCEETALTGLSLEDGLGHRVDRSVTSNDDWRGSAPIIPMSFTYQIDPQGGIIEIRGAGVITQAEYVAGVMSWMIDPLFRPGLDGLCDFTAAESTPTMAELRELIDLVARHTAYVGRVKVAMIVSKPIVFGVARQFASLAEAAQLEVQLFRDRDSAMSWLRPAGQTP
jgi:hypothetical protein